MSLTLPKMDQILLTTEGCRYCLMCRHVCPVTRVTYSEATSPHGWALTIASLRRGLLEWNPQTVDLLYHCADCGLCQAHCVTDQPLPQAIVAARAEAVSLGHAPAPLREIETALREWGNPWREAPRTSEVEAAGDVLFVGATAWHFEPAEVEAAGALLHGSDVPHAAIGVGRSSGYLAYTLGLHDVGALAGRDDDRGACAAAVSPAGGAFGRTGMDAFACSTRCLGVPLPEEVEVVELTVLLAALLDEGRCGCGRPS